MEFREAIREWGLKPVPLGRLCEGMDEVLAYRSEIETQRDELPYEIDGLVVKVDEPIFSNASDKSPARRAGPSPINLSRARQPHGFSTSSPRSAAPAP